MIVLASQSPRRADLLRNANIEFEVVPAHVPEEHRVGESAEAYVQRLARDKALAVLKARPEAVVLGADTTVVVDLALTAGAPSLCAYPSVVAQLAHTPLKPAEGLNGLPDRDPDLNRPPAPILPPNSVAQMWATAKEIILEKPKDAEDAKRMLRLLSGRPHRVMTGVCLAWNDNGASKCDVRVQGTVVRFSALSEQEIADYISTGEPMDKAGAYGIQGIASRWIEELDGCYFSVMGLPVPLVYRMLREHGTI